MPSSPQSQNLLLAALPADDFELLRPNLQLIDLARGLVLVRSGDLPTRAYFPVSGVIASCVTLSDGRLVEASIVGREGTLGAAKGAGERAWFNPASATTQSQPIGLYWSWIRWDLEGRAFR